ncbi:hypothetical protein KAFR_0H01880 [Kazachstania africana CBS 2517]|uniref:Octanoyltransferase n=1 Tax=Kazachstania africana (strain ATCC 22294 / BCRC 22015 / CBS 2517 / CECT 1963 / NBRC 1671 / NRRL Y-8276) TaxID=1071382 RepID=H2AZ41_KAZAF|nr:hypothetical protein KAFR_0H01880 [Kazachstania africana CBS 2517]CCF59597.1 hypothetical protein KAFR_0H01880 [Kazachstania africana CBS 2517]
MLLRSVSSRDLVRVLGLKRFSTINAFKKTEPIDPSAGVLRHIQFTERMPFETGLCIQEKFVRAHLDMKALQAKIKNKINGLHQQVENATLNPSEKMILDSILAMKPNPLVLTFEFHPTYTGGKRIKKVISSEQIEKFENFVPDAAGIGPMKPTFVQVERGGQITYHGPGQMVAYVILDLKCFRDFPARCLVSAIEKATMNTLKGIPLNDSGEKLDLHTKLTEKTGVWSMQDEKIASIGIHVRRSITSHGVAINVSPNLAYLNTFEMCGSPDSTATSIINEKPTNPVSVQTTAIIFVRELAKVLGISKVERMQGDRNDIASMLE